MFSKRLVALAGIAASLVWASAASAATVSIGFQENGGPIVLPPGEIQVADSASYFGPFGTWNVNSSSGLIGFNTFVTNSFNQATVASTLDVYITAQGLTDPTGPLNIFSGFTQNFLPAGFTVTEATYYDPNDGLWGTGAGSVLLASQAFSSPSSTTVLTLANILSTSFAITARYTIVATGAGAANSTINISAETPLPGTLPLIASGLGAFWFVGRKRKARKLPAVA